MKKYPTILHRPKIFGATLIVGLIFLAIISLVSIYSMRTSSTQEKITANQRNKTVSLMAAEFGVNFITAKIDDKTCTLTSLAQCTITTPAKISNLTNYNAYWATEGNPAVTGNIISFTVVGTSRDSGGTEILGRSRIQFEVQIPIDEIAGRVIETEGNVQVKGRLLIVGGGHANNNWSVTSNNNSVTNGILTSAGGNIDVGGVPAGQLSENASPISLPTVESYYSTQFSGSFTSACNFTSNQNLNGQVIRCTSATFNGPVSNGTIVVYRDNVSIGKNDTLKGITLIVDGNVDIESAAKDVIGSAANPTTLAATGNIQAKGNIGNVYGDMRAGGSIDLQGNGNSVIYGQLRARNNIHANGGLEMQNPAGTPYTPATPTQIKSWYEII